MRQQRWQAPRMQAWGLSCKGAPEPLLQGRVSAGTLACGAFHRLPGAGPSRLPPILRLPCASLLKRPCSEHVTQHLPSDACPGSSQSFTTLSLFPLHFPPLLTPTPTRDEILHIMHRNHIPELKGTWMEEWHQKLHNNTTPDDVPICQAYLAFLEVGRDRPGAVGFRV